MNKTTKHTTALKIRSKEKNLIWENINSILEEKQKLDEEEWKTESEEDFDPGYSEELQISFTLYNHIIYITLSKESDELEFAILDDGSMVAHLQEICHSDCILKIISVDDIPYLNFDLLSKDISLLLKCFVFCSWHETFNFLGDDIEWRDSLKCYLEDYNIFPD